MTTRAEQFATQFETVNDEAIDVVTRCSDEQWRQPAASEGWPLAVVAHHIAAVHGDFIGLVGAFTGGETRSPGGSMEAVHESNARHAQEHTGVSKAETLDLLRSNGAALADLLRQFDDGQLEKVAGTFGDREMSMAQVVEWIVIGHAREHLASLRASVGG